MAPSQDDPRAHPWWQHVPNQHKPQALWRRRRHQTLRLLGSRPGKLVLVLLLFLGMVLAIALSDAGAMGLLVLVPLLIMPALAWLAWWLTWHEYHQ